MQGYLAVSLVFWLLLWALGGSGENGRESVHVEWQAAAFNALLLLPLIRGYRWAKWLLVLEAIVIGAFVASMGIPPFGPAFGLLALFPLAQIVLLIAGDNGEARRGTDGHMDAENPTVRGHGETTPGGS
jgi:hypothetical protein